MSQQNQKFSPWKVIGETVGEDHVVFFLKLMAGGLPTAFGVDARYVALLARLDPKFNQLAGRLKSHLLQAATTFGDQRRFGSQIGLVDATLGMIRAHLDALGGKLPRATECFLQGEETLAPHAAALNKLAGLEVLVDWDLSQFERYFDKPTALECWLRITMDTSAREKWKRQNREVIRAIRGTPPTKFTPPETVVRVMPQTLSELVAIRDQKWYIGDGDGHPMWLIATNGDGPKDQTLTIREWVTSKPKALRDVLSPSAFAFYETACPRFKGSDFDKAVSALGGEGDKKTSRKKPVRD